MSRAQTTPEQLAVRFARAVREDGRFPLPAFEFLQRGLEFTTRRHYGDGPGEDGRRHISGEQLCESLRDLALELWGPLARTVLHRWNIHRTRDFGEMVFLMVEIGLFGKQDSDRLDDFDDVYDFASAFAYEVPLEHFDAEHSAGRDEAPRRS